MTKRNLREANEEIDRLRTRLSCLNDKVTRRRFEPPKTAKTFLTVVDSAGVNVYRAPSGKYFSFSEARLAQTKEVALADALRELAAYLGVRIVWSQHERKVVVLPLAESDDEG